VKNSGHSGFNLDSTRKDRILIVDDDDTFRSVTRALLEDEGYLVVVAGSASEAVRVMLEKQFDLVLTDLVMPGASGLEFLGQIKAHYPTMPVVMVTGFASINSAIDAMKEGAEDYLTKPCGNDELILKVRRCLEKSKEREELQRLRHEVAHRYTFENIIGRSPPMQKVFELISHVAETDATVLIQGETGTGKELVAKAIHYNSTRRNQAYVGVNCAALAETLLESELFGHEKGAFTGAIKQKVGRFTLAHRGTLFLDEIGDIPLPTQAKLLRVLQERRFERVGGTETLQVDIRLISATNRDLTEAIRESRFREDLYYRLNVVPITLPALRERREDVPLLASHFVRHYAQEMGKSVEGVEASALDTLLRYHWPGNVRELENMIERAVVLCQESHISLHHLMLPRRRREAFRAGADPALCANRHGGGRRQQEGSLPNPGDQLSYPAAKAR
jgi:DNA-binding NtrC family response regulator